MLSLNLILFRYCMFFTEHKALHACVSSEENEGNLLIAHVHDGPTPHI